MFAVITEEPDPFVCGFYGVTFLGSLIGLPVAIAVLAVLNRVDAASLHAKAICRVVSVAIPIIIGTSFYGVAFGSPGLVRVGAICMPAGQDC